MKIGLRANASPEIGTGHLVRQLALAEFLFSKKHEVVIIGSVSGPGWLASEMDSLNNLEHLPVDEGDFGNESFSGLNLDVLLVDSYQISQSDFTKIEDSIPTVGAIIDGPWQRLAGRLAIAPTLASQPRWIGDYQKSFQEMYWGPQYFMLRDVVRQSKIERIRKLPGSPFHVVVAMGGADVGGLTQAVLDSLLASPFPCQVDVFTALPELLTKRFPTGSISLEVHQSGPGFIDYAGRASLVIGAAGTMVAELSYLEVPAIYIPVADNQAENVDAIKELGLGILIDPKYPDFVSDLQRAIESVFIADRSGISSDRAIPLVDGRGVARVTNIFERAHCRLLGRAE